jgi:prepilin-type N-terminal cleavage/methylation domain-containing protein
MRPERSAFTLIEVMVAITLAVALSSLAVVGFNQMRKVVQRNQAMTDLASEAAYIHYRLEQDIAICQQTSQMRFERIPSVALAAYPAYATRVMFFGELPNRHPNNHLDSPIDPYAEYTGPQVWLGWEWRPPTANSVHALGSFSMGRSSWKQRTQTRSINGKVYTFYQVPDARRSRKRAPDDNDYRLLPNATAALSAAATTYGLVTGDYTDLFGEDSNGNGSLDPGEDLNDNTILNVGQLAPITQRMKDLHLSWVDYGGSTTSIDAAGGVTPAGGDAWWTGDRRIVDGLYRDGRNPGASVLTQRPGLLRVRFTLVDPTSRIEQTFTFSYCLGLEAVASAGL